MSSSHNDIIALIQTGNQNAFYELSSEFSPVIYGIVDLYETDISEREDIYQEGLLGLYKAALAYSPHMNTSFSTFARICIKHSVISALRVYYGKSNSPLLTSFSIEDIIDECGEIRSLGMVTDPESLIIEQEELDALINIINVSLSKLEQKVLKLYVQGMTYKEISMRLCISAKSVGNAIQRIKYKLKPLIQP